MGRLFGLKENETNVRTEIIAGLTTFATMAYIIFVNPNILSAAGMDKSAVFSATCISAAIATLIMALIANVPFAQAAGMGMNSFFVSIVLTGFAGGTIKISWEQALAIVFFCGVINILITVTRIRRMLINAVPASLHNAISTGIGLFIGYLGLKFSGLIAGDEITLLKLGDLSSPATLYSLAGIVLIAVLMLLKVRGAILIGILAITVMSVIFGTNQIAPGTNLVSLPPSLEPTLLKLDIPGLFMSLPIITLLALILSFSISDTFDTLGTFIGTGRKTGVFTEEDLKFTGKRMKTKLDKALFADATSTSIGSLLGTSNVTTYIESAAGIAEGGKTGLTSLVTASMFLLSLFIAPIVGIVPGYATAPALVIVGVLMMSSASKINFSDFEEALPAFFTIIMMPLTGSIAYGIASGFILYTLVKIIRGKFREVHLMMYTFTVLFLLDFIINA